MRTVILYIAARCNQDCVFCLEVDRTWAPFVDPSTLQVHAEVERLYARGARQITFMGGETFFRKDLPKILEHAKSVGFTRIGVTTNGTVLSKAGFVQRLVDSGLDCIEFSVHGHTPALTEAIVRTTYSHERQARALDEINALGKPFTIVNVVACQENKGQIKDIIEYVCGRLPNVEKRFKIKFLQMTGLAGVSAEGGETLRFEDVDAVGIGDYLEAQGVPYWFYNFPLCRIGRHGAHCHETGALATEETYFDYDHRGGDGYYDSGYQLEGRCWPEATCGACTLRPICPGIESSYRRMLGTSGLVTLHADPLPIITGAIVDRGGDTGQAAERLEFLRGQPRPSVPVIRRPERNLLRFLHGTEPRALELTIAERAAGKPAFLETERFALSYLNWDGLEDPARRPNVAALLRAAGSALEAADDAGLAVAQAIAAVGMATANGWSLEVRQDSPQPDRRVG